MTRLEDWEEKFNVTRVREGCLGESPTDKNLDQKEKMSMVFPESPGLVLKTCKNAG